MPPITQAEFDQKLSEHFDILVRITKEYITDLENDRSIVPIKTAFNLGSKYMEALRSEGVGISRSSCNLINVASPNSSYFQFIYTKITKQIGKDALATKHYATLYDTLTNSPSFLTLFKPFSIARCKEHSNREQIPLEVKIELQRLIDTAISVIQQPWAKPALFLR